MPTRDGLGLATGERLRYRGPLRGGGEVAVTDRRLLIDDGEGLASVPFENVREVVAEGFDWYLGALSAALLVFGLVSLDVHLLGGAAFLFAGAGSLYRTYRRRDPLVVRVHSRPKPLTVYPDDEESVYAEIDASLAQFGERRNES